MINKNTFKLETDSGVELWQKKKKMNCYFLDYKQIYIGHKINLRFGLDNAKQNQSITRFLTVLKQKQNESFLERKN